MIKYSDVTIRVILDFTTHDRGEMIEADGRPRGEIACEINRMSPLGRTHGSS